MNTDTMDTMPTAPREAFAFDNLTTGDRCPDCGAGATSRSPAFVILDLHPDDTGQGVVVPCPVCQQGHKTVLAMAGAQRTAEDEKRRYTGVRSFWAPSTDRATKQGNTVSWNNGRTLHGRYCHSCKRWERWDTHAACVAGRAGSELRTPRVGVVA